MQLPALHNTIDSGDETAGPRFGYEPSPLVKHAILGRLGAKVLPKVIPAARSLFGAAARQVPKATSFASKIVPKPSTVGSAVSQAGRNTGRAIAGAGRGLARAGQATGRGVAQTGRAINQRVLAPAANKLRTSMELAPAENLAAGTARYMANVPKGQKFWTWRPWQMTKNLTNFAAAPKYPILEKAAPRLASGLRWGSRGATVGTAGAGAHSAVTTQPPGVGQEAAGITGEWHRRLIENQRAMQEEIRANPKLEEQWYAAWRHYRENTGNRNASSLEDFLRHSQPTPEVRALLEKQIREANALQETFGARGRKVAPGMAWEYLKSKVGLGDQSAVSRATNEATDRLLTPSWRYGVYRARKQHPAAMGAADVLRSATPMGAATTLLTHMFKSPEPPPVKEVLLDTARKYGPEILDNPGPSERSPHGKSLKQLVPPAAFKALLKDVAYDQARKHTAEFREETLGLEEATEEPPAEKPLHELLPPRAVGEFVEDKAQEASAAASARTWSPEKYQRAYQGVERAIAAAPPDSQPALAREWERMQREAGERHIARLKDQVPAMSPEERQNYVERSPTVEDGKLGPPIRPYERGESLEEYLKGFLSSTPRNRQELGQLAGKGHDKVLTQAELAGSAVADELTKMYSDMAGYRRKHPLRYKLVAEALKYGLRHPKLTKSNAATKHAHQFVSSCCGRTECSGCPGASERIPAVWYALKQAAEQRKVVAVDLDGTLAKHYDEFDPDDIPGPRPGAKSQMDRIRETGAKIIINTCRGQVETVRAWLNEHDIPFDHINHNPEQPADASDKIMADVYLDDKGVDASQPLSRATDQVLEKLSLGGLHDSINVNGKSAEPYWQRGVRGQLAQPTWNSQRGILGNVADNLSGARDKAQRQLKDHEFTEQFRSALQPGYSLERFQRYMQRGDHVRDPIDRALFRNELLGMPLPR